MAQLIVFTDLDGTLLDHNNYRWEAARPALKQLRARRMPVILCTSKT
ncbi:MAG: HAD hydrolase family protein, partial [Candidatus Acidiferrales bacterium]